MISALENTISSADFQKNARRHLKAAREGGGPVAVREGDDVVGVLLSAEDYDALYGAAIRELLKSRMKGPTVSQNEAKRRIREQVRRMQKRR